MRFYTREDFIACRNREIREKIQKIGGKMEMEQETRPLVSGTYLEYMGRPLVRQDDTICYGDMSEKCILVLEIMSRDPATGLPLNVLVQLVDSKDSNKIIRQIGKKGLYDAFSIGLVWLERALQE